MGSQEDLRKLGFQTGLKIFQERKKPRKQQDLTAMANWEKNWTSILDGLDRGTGKVAAL